MRAYKTFFSLTLLFISLSSSALASQAHILHIEGTVEAKAPSEDWKPVQKGAALGEGSLVRTGAASSCEIAIDGSKSVVRMKENSQTALPAITETNVRVELKEGKVLVWLRDLPKKSSFQVSSPTAVATARGTGWEQGMDEMRVFENSVEVAGAGGDSKVLEEGQGIGFESDGLGEIFEVPQEARAEWDSFQDEADKHIAEEDAPAPAQAEEKTEAAAATEAAPSTEENAFDAFEPALEAPDSEDAAGEGIGEALSGAQEDQAESEDESDDEQDNGNLCYNGSGQYSPC